MYFPLQIYQIYHYFCNSIYFIYNIENIRTIRKILIGLLIFVCAVPFASYVALQFPGIQTSIAQKVVHSLEPKINGHIDIDRIAIVFFNKVVAYDMSIIGTEGDTLAAIGKLSVAISPKDLLTGRLVVNRIALEDGYFSLITYNKKTKDTNLKRILNLKKKEKEKKPLNLPNIRVSSIVLKNFRYKMFQAYKDFEGRDPRCFNVGDMDLRNINLRIHRARYSDGVLTCRIRDLSCRDKCGYEVRSLSGFFAMDSSETSIQNLHLMDSYSKVTAKYLSFGYESGKDLKQFVNKIVLGADFNQALIDFRSIGMFAPALVDNHLRLELTGEVKGPVSDLQSERLIIFSGDSTFLDLGFRITGLPKIRNTVFDATINEATTTGLELSDIISNFSRTDKENGIANVMPPRKVRFHGDILGTLDDLHSAGLISTGHSSVDYDATLFNHHGADGVDIQAALTVRDLDVKDFTNSDLIGEVSLNTALSLNLKKKEYGGLSFDIDSLNILGLELNGYNYKDIHLLGGMNKGTLNVRMLSKDYSFSSILQAVIQFENGFKPQRIQTFLDIPYADLKAINVIKEGEKAEAGIHLEADVRFQKDKSLLGSILLDNINYSNDFGHFVLDSLHLHSILSEDQHIVTLRSPILTANYTSTDAPNRLIKRIKRNLVHTTFPKAFEQHAAELSADPDMQAEDGNYKFKLVTHNTSQICDIVMPGLHIAENTSIDILLDEQNKFDFSLTSDIIKIGNNRFRNIAMNLDNRDSLLNADFDIRSISIGKIPLNNTRITARQQSEGVLVGLGFNNSDSTNLGLSSLVQLSRNKDRKLVTDIRFNESQLALKGHQWVFSPAEIRIAPQEYSIRNFNLFSDTESIALSGEISRAPGNKVTLDLDNFDLSLINSFFSKTDLGLYGSLSGHVELSNLLSTMGVTLNLEGSDMKVFNRDFGRLTAMSKWDQSRKRFNILLNNELRDGNPINATGYFIPERSYINLNLGLDGLEAYYLSPILENAVEINGGRLSGDVKVVGQFSRLSISSDNLYMDSIYFTPQFTRVPYYLSGPVEVSDRSIDLNMMEITDPNGSKATLDGSIGHSSLKDFHLSLGLNFQDLMAINTQEFENSTIYGKAFASGNINLSGGLDDLVIDVQVQTGDNSAIHVPLNSSSSASSSDLISYTNFSDTEGTIRLGADYDAITVTKPKKKSNIQVRGNARISQGTELLIEMNKQMGEILRCRGNGSINLNIAPSRNIMDLRGEYNITSGSYHFVAMTIVSRDFIIDNGGSIAFNGSIKNTNLNIGVTYQTKASISTLIGDNTSVDNRKNVNCGINLSGSLTNPQLSFGIDIPDLDPITKGMVESALSSPDKIQRQFMSLLISGSFVPDQQSGIVNNSSLLYSNASEILSNQFNNIFRQLDIPIDLGLNYQHDGTSGKDMFDFAVSYKAFNNRLIINGNVGNSETSSNWAGDFDAEIKVDKQGKFRISLFTRAADSYSNYLDNTQRSGFGISYQDEFDTFREFIHNLFYSKKRREELELKRIEDMQKELIEEAEAANIKKESILKPKEDEMSYSGDSEVTEYVAEEYVYQEYTGE